MSPTSDVPKIGQAPGQRHLFPRPGIRKPFPRSYPNFRDFGRRVAWPLLDLTQSLQRSHGWCFASESDKRRMLGEDTGHGAGVGTIPEREDSLEARGVLAILRAMPGSLMPDGSECKAGTRLTRVLLGERERMAARLEYARRLADRRRREPSATRPRRALHERLLRMPVEQLIARVRRPANPSRPRPLLPGEREARRAEEFEAARARQIEQATREFAKPEWHGVPASEHDPTRGKA